MLDNSNSETIRDIIHRWIGWAGKRWDTQKALADNSGLDQSIISRALDGNGSKNTVDTILYAITKKDREFPPYGSQADLKQVLKECTKLSDPERKELQNKYIREFPDKLRELQFSMETFHHGDKQHNRRLKIVLEGLKGYDQNSPKEEKDYIEYLEEIIGNAIDKLSVEIKSQEQQLRDFHQTE